MKKKCLLMMATALLFSWAGFAQDEGDEPAGPILVLNGPSFLNEPMSNSQGATYDETTGEVVQIEPWDGVGWQFDGNIVREAEGGNYTGVEIQYTVTEGSNNIRIVMQYLDESDGSTLAQEFVGDYPSGTLKIPIVIGGAELPLIGLVVTSDNDDINTYKLTKAEFIEYVGGRAPAYFTPPIDFELQAGAMFNYEIPVAAWGAAAFPVAQTNEWGWGEASNVIKVVKDPGNASNTCLEIGNGMPVISAYATTNVFQIRLEDGKKFGDIGQIKFNIKRKFQPDVDKVGNGDERFVVLAADKNMILGFQKYTGREAEEDYVKAGWEEAGDIINWPLYFWSFEYYNIGEVEEVDGAVGDWQEVIIYAEDFWNIETNQGMYFEYGEGGFYAEGEPDRINGLSNFQFAIGLGQNTSYYIDDIDFVYCQGDECRNGVKNIAAAPSIKVYPIPGGLAIQGAEKASIYGIDGSLIATATGKISLPKGVYIVKAGSEAVKAIVK